jgi:ribosomal-protein-alanine N-acetyltransferase
VLRFIELRTEDLEQVVSLEEEVFTHPWSRQAIDEMMKDQNICFLVAKIGNEVVGNCALRMILDEGEITNVSVKEIFRGRGIAKEMLGELMKIGLSRGVSNFTLEVRKKNNPAISLYEKLGFEKEGIRKNFYRDPIDDAWIMWKRD